MKSVGTRRKDLLLPARDFLPLRLKKVSENGDVVIV